MNTQIEPFWSAFRQTRIFPKKIFKKLGSPSFEYFYGCSTSCKTWDKSNEPILRKNVAIMDNQINQFWAFLAHFRTSKKFSKKFGPVTCQFWVVLVPKLQAKYKKKLMSQSWKKCCRNGRTHKSGHSGPFWAGKNFPKKFSCVSTYGPSTLCKISTTTTTTTTKTNESILRESAVIKTGRI